ncbi:MFS transporter [Amycolatopsis plumensis]|uniref:MFS transporter n=1 Tax=Amycolatopsis plumensis TaxID=236508 RepID=A0ABV5U8S9_9PSEU
MAVMAMSLVYPQYVSLAHRYSALTAARTIGSLRSFYVVGYIAGLGVFAAASESQTVLGPLLRPVHVAAGLAVVNIAVAWFLEPANGDVAEKPASVEASSVRGRVVLVGAAAALVLLRAADSLRGVYLPLYATDIGVDGTGVSVLSAVTAIAEFVVLVPISMLSDRYGSRRTLVVVCLTGTLAFLLVAVGSGYPILVGSQVFYAAFAAGFQSVGMVLLGEALRSGIGGGAALYTALVQVGSTVSILSPLIVPGYSPPAFLIAMAFCALAAALLIVDRVVIRRPVG